MDKEKIVELVQKGYIDREIAEILNTTSKNIAYHRINLLGKKSNKEKVLAHTKRFDYIDIFLDKDRLAAICGTLLGDSCIFKSSTLSGRLTCSHKESNKDYIEYKVNMLGDLFSNLSYKEFKSNYFIKETRIINSKPQYMIKSKSSPSLLKLREILYLDNGQKSITKDYLKYMNAESIALYYFDDGSKIINKKRNFYCYKIYMYSFSEESKLNLSNWLKEKFDINSTVTKNTLNISSNSRDKFKNLISPFVVDSMKYKL